MTVPKIKGQGRGISKAALLDLPIELYDEFMPRTHLDKVDIIERNGWRIETFKSLGEQTARNALASFTRDEITGDTDKGIPLRLMFSADSEVATTGLHSFDVESSFRNFTQQLIFKDELDEAYAFGKSLQNYFKTKKSLKGANQYKYAQQFMEDHLVLHFLGGVQNDKSRWWNKHDFVVSDKLANSKIGEVFNLKEGQVIALSGWKLMKMLKSFGSVAAMAFKLTSASFNLGLILGTNLIKATSGSIATSFFNVDPKDVDFTIPTLARAVGDYLHYHWQTLPGVGRSKKQAKLYNIAQKLNFLPESYDYDLRKESIVERNKLFDWGNLFIFHKISEDFGSFTVLAASLRHSKFEVLNEETGETSVMSLYDMYDDQGNEKPNLTRGFERLQDGTLKKLRGISEDEAHSFRRVMERIHGSYAEEERLAIELNILGQLGLQFKKYIPTLIKQN